MDKSSFSAAMLLTVALLALVLPGRADTSAGRERTPDAKALFDSDADHLWNRLYQTLFIRVGPNGAEYGFDTPDPLLWSATKQLLAGESHKNAVRILDEFLERHGEKLIEDPLKRAILQRDLWAIFDWAAARNRHEQIPIHETEVRELTVRLAKVIQRLALTKEEFPLLPDNYTAAVASKIFPDKFDFQKPDAGFLPADLFKDDGPWCCIEKAGCLVAPVHTREFGGRSVFLIFVSLPNGRAETLAYLEKLNSFPEPWIYDRARLEKTGERAMMSGVMPHRFDPKRLPWVNPDMPQFPSGTQFALVRQAVLIDREGKLIPTHLTENVQIRVYRDIHFTNSRAGAQSVFEFKLRRKNLFAGRAGGLHAVENDEKDFSVFLTKGFDPFEFAPRNRSAPSDPRGTAMNCMECHEGAGIHSVLSHSQLFSYPTALQVPKFESASVKRIGDFTVGWKNDQATWGLLQGLWQREDRVP